MRDLIYWPNRQGDECDCGCNVNLPGITEGGKQPTFMTYKRRYHHWFLLVTWLRTCRPRRFMTVKRWEQEV